MKPAYLIEKGLYQGGRPKEIPPDVTALVNLECEEDVPSLLPALGKPKMCQVLLPIYDGPYPGHAWLSTAVSVVEALRAGGHVVLVHCRGGVSRSVMVTAAVLMKKHGWDVDDAMNFIATTNSTLNPSPGFLRGLKDWRSCAPEHEV